MVPINNIQSSRQLTGTLPVHLAGGVNSGVYLIIIPFTRQTSPGEEFVFFLHLCSSGGGGIELIKGKGGVVKVGGQIC